MSTFFRFTLVSATLTLLAVACGDDGEDDGLFTPGGGTDSGGSAGNAGTASAGESAGGTASAGESAGGTASAGESAGGTSAGQSAGGTSAGQSAGGASAGQSAGGTASAGESAGGTAGEPSAGAGGVSSAGTAGAPAGGAAGAAGAGGAPAAGAAGAAGAGGAPPEPECEVNADCNDNSTCTDDACNVDGQCEHQDNGSCGNDIIAIEVGDSVTGTTTNTDGDYADDDCDATNTDEADEQVYSFVPTMPGAYTITTCGDDTEFDTVLYVRQGDPNSGDVDCNDDVPADSCSRIILTVSQGDVNTTFYIIVDGLEAEEYGTFDLSITGPGA